jgi:mannan endo-1,4-beta-mannosidase
MTFEHGLNNLIWLWNGEAADWYPGDDYVDIIGEDIYAGERNYASQINKFMQAVNYADTPKIVTLSENGTLFDPDLALRDGAMWGFWATWSGHFVVRRGLWLLSEEFTEEEMLMKVYNHEIVVTLEDLPCLKTYPIREN